MTPAGSSDQHSWVESMGAIKPRISLLNLYVRISTHTASDIL